VKNEYSKKYNPKHKKNESTYSTTTRIASNHKHLLLGYQLHYLVQQATAIPSSAANPSSSDPVAPSAFSIISTLIAFASCTVTGMFDCPIGALVLASLLTVFFN
jgi:hypothetical protein